MCVHLHALHQLQVGLLDFTKGALHTVVVIAQHGFVNPAIEDGVHFRDKLISFIGYYRSRRS